MLCNPFLYICIITLQYVTIPTSVTDLSQDAFINNSEIKIIKKGSSTGTIGFHIEKKVKKLLDLYFNMVKNVA